MRPRAAAARRPTTDERGSRREIPAASFRRGPIAFFCRSVPGAGSRKTISDRNFRVRNPRRRERKIESGPAAARAKSAIPSTTTTPPPTPLALTAPGPCAMCDPFAAAFSVFAALRALTAIEIPLSEADFTRETALFRRSR